MAYNKNISATRNKLNELIKKIMKEDYHYSVKFAGEDLRFHGCFETAFKDLKTIKANARKSIAAKLPEWGFVGDDIEYFEIYMYENDNEKQIFEWKK